MRRVSASALLVVAAVLLLAGARALPASGAENSARADLLRKAESELRRGDASAALDDFERAAMMRHAADAELGLIRAALQQGLYRRALAFCAHTAGEHLEETDAAALYAWLLRAGGQGRFAERVLADALRRAPADPVLREVDATFRDDPVPVARGKLLQAEHRLAPWPVPAPPGQALPGTGARFVGGAVLIGDGSRAVAPLAAIPASVAGGKPGRLWVRNGLGQTSAASLEPAVDGSSLASDGVVLLRLATPLPLASSVQAGAREPFAGSPGYVLRFAATAQVAWPWLSQGFLGGGLGVENTVARRLGFDMVGGSRAGNAAGAPVFDATGRLAGMVIGAAPDGGSIWLPATSWQAADKAELPARGTSAAVPVVAASDTAGSSAAQAQASPPDALLGSAVPSRRGLVAPDAIYEAGLPLALQLLVEGH